MTSSPLRPDEYRRLYKTAQWQRLRADQLALEPLCRMCSDVGLLTTATICDHITPHKGNVEKFWNGPFQSLCKHCHDSRKQRMEHGKGGYALDIGIDGYPIDPNHPSNVLNKKT